LSKKKGGGQFKKGVELKPEGKLSDGGILLAGRKANFNVKDILSKGG